MYGDSDRIVPLLEKEGYSEGSLGGARLTLRKIRGDVVCPYIDKTERATVDGGYLVLDPSGELFVQGTEGLAEEYGVECGNCGTRVDSDDAYQVQTDRYEYQTWCSCCAADNTVECEYSAYRIPEDSAIAMADGDYYWSSWVFQRHGGFCEETEVNYPLDELVTLDDGRTVHRDVAALLEAENNNNEQEQEAA